MNTYLALDIGGTFIKYGIVNDQTEILKQGKIKTPKTLERLFDQIEELAKLYPDSSGLAISAPGAVSDEGVIYGSSALPYLHGPNIKELLMKRIGMAVHMENDANCAGYAEVWNGAAKGKQDVMVIVIGTGIGGAVFKNGSLHKGANLHGGEFGYMLMSPMSTGFTNTWSGAASTIAMVKKVASAKGVHPDTLSGEAVFELAEDGDKVCREAIDEFYHLLAVGIYNLQHVYDPEAIVIGGGISAREDLIDKINEKLDQIQETVPVAKIKPYIVACQFRNNASLLGAVYGLMKNKNRLNTESAV